MGTKSLTSSIFWYYSHQDPTTGVEMRNKTKSYM